MCTLLTAIAAALLVAQEEEDADDVFKVDDQKRSTSLVTMEPVRHTKARRTTSVRSDAGLYVIKEEENDMPDHISLRHRFSTTSLPALAPLIKLGENVYVRDDSDMKDVFVVTKNPFHLDRRYCQNLNMAATALVLAGYIMIGLSISIGMKFIIFIVLRVSICPVSCNDEEYVNYFLQL